MKSNKYLASKAPATAKPRQISAGAKGPALGVGGKGMPPKSSARPLTRVEKALKDKGV